MNMIFLDTGVRLTSHTAVTCCWLSSYSLSCWDLWWVLLWVSADVTWPWFTLNSWTADQLSSTMPQSMQNDAKMCLLVLSTKYFSLPPINWQNLFKTMSHLAKANETIPQHLTSSPAVAERPHNASCLSVATFKKNNNNNNKKTSICKAP